MFEREIMAAHERKHQCLRNSPDIITRFPLDVGTFASNARATLAAAIER
jgi:hypothetical protein